MVNFNFFFAELFEVSGICSSPFGVAVGRIVLIYLLIASLVNTMLDVVLIR